MTARLIPLDSLQRIVDTYMSTEQTNDAIWELFTERVNQTAILKDHRDWIEANRWGFGDRAFHYLWLLLIQDLADYSKSPIRMLEIGVFKGQTLSLWALLCREAGVDAELVGISPMLGKPPLPRVFHRARMLVDSGYREDALVGNLHVQSDFALDVQKVFDTFGLTLDGVTLIRGLSQESSVWEQVRDQLFDVVYIDGGHRYEEVSEDLRRYAPLVREGGYLVVDDASFFEPGTVFFKGFESVSKAAGELDRHVYRNVLNVGHNRVYVKASPGG